jgi:uncharacterized protein (TIGR02217 family)
MSNDIFPSLPGLKITQVKNPIFSTRVQKATSGRELRAAYYVYPLFRYDLSFEILRDDATYNELKTLMGFYMQRQGAAQTFLYSDPTDNAVVKEAIGIGNGSNKVFQLYSSYGGFLMPRKDIRPRGVITPVLEIYLDNVAQDHAAYSVATSDSGIVTFVSAPGSNKVITASFSFYYRVRFKEFSEGDESFTRIFDKWWEAKKISLLMVRDADSDTTP